MCLTTCGTEARQAEGLRVRAWSAAADRRRRSPPPTHLLRGVCIFEAKHHGIANLVLLHDQRLQDGVQLLFCSRMGVRREGT